VEPVKDPEIRALRLTPQERGELIHRLILSLDGPADGTPEQIATAWDEEIARRLEDMEAGRSTWVPADQVMEKIRARIADARASRGD
jgi:putative addiction module component (TIGR02574 family)